MTQKRQGLKIALALLLFIIIALPIAHSKDSKQTDNTIPASAETICPLLIGAKAPKIALRTADGKPFDLHGAIVNKPTILVFYRGAW